MKQNSSVNKLVNRFQAFRKHPLTRRNPLGAMGRYSWFHLSHKLAPKRRCYRWIGGLKFYADRSDGGIVGNFYFKLFDYDESMFVINQLEEGELFVDIGANVGHFSLLAAGIARAKVLAIEPIPSTFEKLEANVRLNRLEGGVDCRNIGVGEEEGDLQFLKNRTVMNRVALDGEEGTVEVPVKTLDSLLQGEQPAFLKIDVEGFELPVLKGGRRVLGQPSLRCLLVEFNRSGEKYGHSDDDVFGLICDSGFAPISYDGETGKIRLEESYNRRGFNTLFLRRDRIPADA